MIMYAFVPWSSFVPCCLFPASPFRMGPPRSVRPLASFLSPDRTAGRVVYLCHSSTQIRLSYLFSLWLFWPCLFRAATQRPLRSAAKVARYLHVLGKFPLKLRSRNKGKCATDSVRCLYLHTGIFPPQLVFVARSPFLSLFTRLPPSSFTHNARVTVTAPARDRPGLAAKPSRNL